MVVSPWRGGKLSEELTHGSVHHAHAMAAFALTTGNMHLLGLQADDPARSLQVCVEGLFHNALDATASETAARRVEVALSPEASLRRWRVSIWDNGPGFTADALAHAEDGIMGVLGLGLKAVLLWARVSSGALVIRTAARDALHMSHMQLRLVDAVPVTSDAESIDARGDEDTLRPMVSIEHVPKPADHRTTHGTCVECVLGGAPEALERLAHYFVACQALLSAAPLELTFHLDDAPAQSVLVAATQADRLFWGSREEPPALPGVREHLTMLAAMSHQAQLCGDETPSAAPLRGFGEAVTVLDGAHVVHSTVLIVAASDRGAAFCGAASARAPPPAIARAHPIALSRCTIAFLNNRKLGTHELSPLCATIAGMKKARWRSFGASLVGGGAGDDGGGLQVAFEATEVCGLWVAVHLKGVGGSPTMRFGDLAKSFVLPGKALVDAIASALEGALTRAQAELCAQGVPLSRRDRQGQRDHQLAASIVSSIAQIVCESRDASLLPQCLELLHMDYADGGEESDHDAGRPSSLAASSPSHASAELVATVEHALLRHLVADWAELWASPASAAPDGTAADRRRRRQKRCHTQNGDKGDGERADVVGEDVDAHGGETDDEMQVYDDLSSGMYAAVAHLDAEQRDYAVEWPLESVDLLDEDFW